MERLKIDGSESGGWSVMGLGKWDRITGLILEGFFEGVRVVGNFFWVICFNWWLSNFDWGNW